MLAAPAAQAGLGLQVTETGRLSLSADGAGSTSASAVIQVDKPNSGATVRGAYLSCASIYGRVISAGHVSLDGTPVVWSATANGTLGADPNFFRNVFGNVTAMVKPKVDAAAPGLVSFTQTEITSSTIDGCALYVIFDDPSVSTENTIFIFFGSQQPTGDSFGATLPGPLDAGDMADLGVAISFSASSSDQITRIDVNGSRLTSSAGGEDDGTRADGALITVGGIGDTNANPPPFSSPGSNPRFDDELYDLRPFVSPTDTAVQIVTTNPTSNDNLFSAHLLVTGGPTCFAIDAIDDAFTVLNDGSSTGFSVLGNDECRGDPPISVVTLPGDLMPDRSGAAITDGTTVTYTPAPGFVGFEEFSYTAQDAGLEGGDDPPSVDRDTAWVVVEVLEDLVPDAIDDVATTLQTQSTVIDVLANDSLGNPPTVLEIETSPANGSATVQSDDTIRYVPSSSFFGEDRFEYRLTDQNGDSDVATVTVGVFFVRGTVPIDIMPNDAGNNLNLRSGPGSGFDVAILSVGEFFDAPNQIDPLTLKLGPRQANIWGAARARDVDGDGDDDLVVKFLTQQTGIACGDSHATLSGRTFDFQSISGTDTINTFNCPRVRKRH